MATTLTYLSTTLTLPEGLLWADEFGWVPVAQAREYSITGALVVQPSTKQAGRPITLRGGPRHGWASYSLVEQLRVWQAIAGAVMTLSLRAVNHQVIFDQEGPGIEASPVIDYSAPAAADPYVITLRLIKV